MGEQKILSKGKVPATEKEVNDNLIISSYR